jgi:hypothetical protein
VIHSAVLRSEEPCTLWPTPPIFDSALAVVRVKQICPRDHIGDDEQFGLELDLRIVEDLHCREHRFTGLFTSSVATDLTRRARFFAIRAGYYGLRYAN